MNKSGGIGASVLAFICTCNSPALAHFTKLDDFQRKPSTNMNPKDSKLKLWHENRLDFSIVKADSTNNVAQARNHAVMTYVGDLQDLSEATDWFAVTAIHGPKHAREYAGLVLGYANLANYVLVAVEDNDRDGLFDHILISRGVAPRGSWYKNKHGKPNAKWYSVAPIDPTREVTLRARIADDFSHPGMLTIIAQLDGNHNGIWGEPEDDTLVRGNLKPAGLGTDVGLAGTGCAKLDDFGGYTVIPDPVPEPATLAILAWASLAFRRRLHCPSH